MLLRLEELIQELQKDFSVRAFNVNAQMFVTKVEIFPENYRPASDSLKKDTLYILDYRTITRFDPHLEMGPLLCTASPEIELEMGFFRGRTVILISCRKKEDLLVALSDHLYRLGGRSSRLSEVSQEIIGCLTARELLVTGSRLLGNPIIVMDKTQRIIMYTDPAEVKDPGYDQIVAMKSLPIGYLDAGSLFGSNPENQSRILSPKKKEGSMGMLCRQLKINTLIIGFLVVLDIQRPFSVQDRHTLLLLGNLMAIELMNHPEAQTKLTETDAVFFLRSVLDGHITSSGDILRRWEALGYDPDEHYRAIVAVFRDKQPNMLISHLEIGEMLANIYETEISLVYHNIILLLLPVREGKDAVKDRQSTAGVLSLLEKYDMVLGISNIMTDISSVVRYTYLAETAIQLGIELHPKERIYDFKDYAVYLMIKCCLQTDEPDVYLQPELFHLFDYCRKNNNDDLLDTLRVYLMHGRNKAKTAEDLFVHINTIKYRISQIEDILQLSLRDDDDTLHLMLSMKIMEYADHFRGKEATRFSSLVRSQRQP